MNVVLLASAAALALAAAPSPAAACDCNHEGKSDKAAAVSPLAAPEAVAPKKAVKGAQVVKLTVTQDGFVPEVVKVKAGAPVQLVVTRTAEVTCATEIVLKDFGVNQPLPLDKPVTVTVTPKAAGAYRFACAMDMIAGTLQAE